MVIRPKWWILMGMAAIAVGVMHWTMDTPQSIAALSPGVRDHRTGDLMIQVVDLQGRAIANAAVNLEQTAHAFEFGTALSTEMFSPTANPAEQKQYLNLTQQLFNAGVHENALKWYATEPARGQVSYAEADRILDWSKTKGLKMRGHTLFWAVEKWNQPWVKALNKQDLRSAVQRRATEVCRRYRGKISEYDVLNEMLHGDFFQQRLGDGIAKQMFAWCHTADPTARLYVNDYDILNGKLLDRYIQQIRSLLQQGVPVGGIGVQAHIREPTSAAQIQRTLDALAQFRLPIKITELGVVAATESEQAQILKDVYSVAFAHPAVTGILMWGFWEGANWEPRSAVFKRNFEPTLAAKTYRELVFQQWWTKAKGNTDKTGTFSTRAFFGNYQMTLTVGGQSVQRSLSFSPQTKMPQVITVAR